MRSFLFTVCAATLVLTPSLADAGNHKSKNNKGGASVGHCPPGLAKKNPPCVPPGQVKKYNRGDIIDGNFDLIRNPERYGFRRGSDYYRAGDYVYSVNRETREILDRIGAVDAVLN